MAWSIGAVTLETFEEPDDGFVEFGRKALWAYFNPVGFDGRIRQFTGYDANDHELHLFCGEVTMLALRALVGPAPVTLIAPRPRFENGLQMTVESVSARWTKQTPGCWTEAEITAALSAHPTGDGFGWYDVTIRLVELAEV